MFGIVYCYFLPNNPRKSYGCSIIQLWSEVNSIGSEEGFMHLLMGSFTHYTGQLSVEQHCVPVAIFSDVRANKSRTRPLEMWQRSIYFWHSIILADRWVLRNVVEMHRKECFLLDEAEKRVAEVALQWDRKVEWRQLFGEKGEQKRKIIWRRGKDTHTW